MIHVATFTCNFNCCSVEFSPFIERRFAVATAQHFGVIGNGCQHVLELVPGGHGGIGFIVQVASFESPEGLYDCAWSESNEFQLASASGDGCILLWDLAEGHAGGIHNHDGYPLARFCEHQMEAVSVNWGPLEKSLLLSASWDQTVKLWHIGSGSDVSLRTFTGHVGPVYQAVWSPSRPGVFATCSGDRTVRLWDSRDPSNISPMAIAATLDGEVLSLDWDKYSDWLIVSGGTDCGFHALDIRTPGRPLASHAGHGLGVTRVKSHPWVSGCAGSVSYDMGVCVWDYHTEGVGGKGLHSRCDYHTEFTTGLDFSTFIPNRMVSCSMDKNVVVWDLDLPR